MLVGLPRLLFLVGRFLRGLRLGLVLVRFRLILNLGLLGRVLFLWLLRLLGLTLILLLILALTLILVLILIVGPIG